MATTLEWQNDAGENEVINFDANPHQQFEEAAEATEHAVESGQAVTDYVRPNAPTISLELVVTNTPIVSALSQMDGATENNDGIDLTVGNTRVPALVTQWTGEFDRVTAVDTLLRDLKDRGRLVKIYTGLRVVDRLVITRVSVDRDADSGNALMVSLDLKRIRIASTQRVAAPRRLRRPVNRGSQPATPAALQSVGTGLLGAAGIHLRGS